MSLWATFQKMREYYVDVGKTASSWLKTFRTWRAGRNSRSSIWRSCGQHAKFVQWRKFPSPNRFAQGWGKSLVIAKNPLERDLLLYRGSTAFTTMASSVTSRVLGLPGRFDLDHSIIIISVGSNDLKVLNMNRTLSVRSLNLMLTVERYWIWVWFESNSNLFREEYYRVAKRDLSQVRFHSIDMSCPPHKYKAEPTAAPSEMFICPTSPKSLLPARIARRWPGQETQIAKHLHDGHNIFRSLTFDRNRRWILSPVMLKRT